MPIRVRCPNPECKKLLNVPDEAAGKKCRCPTCKSDIRVPPKKPAQPTAKSAEAEDAAFSEKLKPVRKAKPSPREPDRNRDIDEDEEPKPRGKGRRDEDSEDGTSNDRPGEKPHPCTPLNLLQFLLGVAFLLGLAFMPMLPWVTIASDVESGTKKEGTKKESGSMTVSGLGKATGTLPDLATGQLRTRDGDLAGSGRPEGLLLLSTALTASLLALILFVIAMLGFLGEDASRHAATAATLILVMACVLLLIWQLAWVWKTVTLADVMRQEADQPQVGLKARVMTSTTRPGLGLYIGLGLGVAGAYVFSNLAGRFTRTLWCRLAELGGLLLGGLVLLTMVRAWDAQALWDAIQAL